MKNRVVTISRQFGSGGRTIGKQLAQQLNIPCYDQELVEQIAAQSGLAKEFITENGEYTAYSGWFANALATRDFSGRSTQDYLWSVQRNIILELAQKGPCVIVGRCADYILRDTADCLTVFIYADMEMRAKRIVEQYGQRQDSPEKRLRDKDKRRAAYYQFYTDMKWGAVENYHVALNSGILGLDRCVQILAQLY